MQELYPPQKHGRRLKHRIHRRHDQQLTLAPSLLARFASHSLPLPAVSLQYLRFYPALLAIAIARALICSLSILCASNCKQDDFF